MTTTYQAANFRDQAPAEVFDPTVFPDVLWVGDPDAAVEDNLVSLREAMAADSDAAVLIGGRSDTSLTPVPGVRDEYKRFLDHHPKGPVCLVGLLGGEARRLAEEAEAG
jgi:hypothetical protein